MQLGDDARTSDENRKGCASPIGVTRLMQGKHCMIGMLLEDPPGNRDGNRGFREL